MTRIGSLFSGYSGLDMAVRNVFGGELAWVSDIDPGACKILAHHHPDVPNLGDITTVDWATVEPVGILTGGSPCQDLSHAGKRSGMKDGTRSNLWVSMREAIAQLRPSLVVWENVRGAYSAAADSDVEPCPGCVGNGPGVHLRALGRVLGDLADIGYDAIWHGLTAASVGAPHGRFRVFMVAYPYQSGSQGAQPEAGSLLSDRSDPAADAHQFRRNWWAGEIGPGRWGQPADSGHIVPDATSPERGGTEPNDLGSPGGSTTEPRERVSAVAWGQFEPAIRRWERVLNRSAPAPTETSRKGGQRLSPVFVEWMMGLPQGHVTDVPEVGRNDQLKALGNGVVPLQAAVALRYLLTASGCAA